MPASQQGKFEPGPNVLSVSDPGEACLLVQPNGAHDSSPCGSTILIALDPAFLSNSRTYATTRRSFDHCRPDCPRLEHSLQQILLPNLHKDHIVARQYGRLLTEKPGPIREAILDVLREPRDNSPRCLGKHGNTFCYSTTSSS